MSIKGKGWSLAICTQKLMPHVLNDQLYDGILLWTHQFFAAVYASKLGIAEYLRIHAGAGARHPRPAVTPQINAMTSRNTSSRQAAQTSSYSIFNLFVYCPKSLALVTSVLQGLNFLPVISPSASFCGSILRLINAFDCSIRHPV